jgi:hypothetical protein
MYAAAADSRSSCVAIILPNRDWREGEEQQQKGKGEAEVAHHVGFSSDGNKGQQKCCSEPLPI